MSFLNKYWIACVLTLGAALSPDSAIRAQSGASDSSSTPHDSSASHHGPIYHVNFWVSTPIILAGGIGGLVWVGHPKSNITDAQLSALSQNNVPSFDRISLHQNIALVPTWDVYAHIGQIVGAAMPLVILLDGDIRPDWLNVITIGLEVNMVTLGIYSLSPMGPNFIDRYRPQVYYSHQDAAAHGLNQNDGFNKSSFYSGHTASVAASSFFLAKVYSDYHPDANKYLVYGAASIPPLLMGYIRFMTLDHFPSDIAVGFAVGTLCGILIPELHRIGDKNLSMGVYSSPTGGTGLKLQWTSPVLASK
ncbi:MAG TPA: phosphatase PAP2 family protein [Candidatus Kapabacteria bacterium]|jgi:membrane-associated phospholipid phosphatase|nr:phosphatase PAP2 family protein [Candidatus Kapabacteria bacterium]